MFRIHLIPLLPLLSAAVLLAGARVWPRALVHGTACGSVFAAFLVALDGWLRLRGLGEGAALRETVYTWIAAGDLRVDVAFLLDPLSSTMTLVVTGIGFLIHVYSTAYLAHDPGYARYFGYLNLFCGAMLVLVLGDSLPVLFVGWEGVGACSYLLIGFWYDQRANADAGRKAFLVNRVGDAGFLLAMFVLLATTGALDFAGMREAADKLTAPVWGVPAATLAAALLLLGATGKSAQIPLYVWLPDAMAGPTPVSALIHAATMVTAGVYLIARMHFLFALAPDVLLAVAVIGGVTALFAATIGFAQTDIKKVLAYSTISQIGFMFLAVGAGSDDAGVFHLVTHAFFKACLFLGAGSVIHALSGEQDLRRMGGLARELPWTHGTFLVSTAAIAGVAGLSGFWSKDAILHQALARHPALFALGLAAALCTAFYMTRLYCLVFTGACRADQRTRSHLHESPAAMTVPLALLALGAAGGGLLHVGTARPLALAVPHADWKVALLSTLAAAAGIAAGAALYWGGERPQVARWVAALGPLYRAVRARYAVDEAYQAALVRPLRAVSHGLHEAVDKLVIDRVGVHAGPAVADFAGAAARRVHNGDVQRYAALLVAGAAGLLFFASRPRADFRYQLDGRRLSVQALGREPAGVEVGWDFDGDGREDLRGDSRPPPWVFERAGTYRVRMRVRDRRWGAVAEAEREVVVR